MRFDIDRKVFSVDQNIAAAGGSATEVLQNIPSVTVDTEGNISLRNNASVEVWINGKPSGLTTENRAQILQQMPAESIESIEVITNPSARFNPEGTAGIINIILKKNRKAGYYGSVTAGILHSYGKKPGGTLGTNINFNSGKFDAYLNIGFRRMNFTGGGNSNRFNLLGVDTLSLLSQNSVSNRSFGGVFMRGGVDYHLNQKNTLSLSSFGMIGSGNSTSLIDYKLTSFPSINILRDYKRDNTDLGTRRGMNLTMDYKYDIDKSGSNFLATVSYSAHKRTSDERYKQTDNLLNALTSDISQTMEGSNGEWLFKADYTKKFSETNRLETGWQSNISNRLSPAKGFDHLINMEIKPYYNVFDYNENNHAVYITYGDRFFEKLSFQAGLRAEYFTRGSDYKFKDINNNWVLKTITIEPKSTFQLYPSAYLSYSLQNNNEVQLNYSRRVNRPHGRQINPFRDYSDSTNISYGNPDLNPEFSSSTELNYIKNWDNHTLSASAYYRFTDNVIQNVNFINQGTMEETYMNIAKSTFTGAEFVAKNRLFRILNLTTSVNLYYNKLDSSVYINPYNAELITKIPQQSTFSWSGRIIANMILGKSTSLQVTGDYSGPRLLPQGTQKSSYSVDLGLRQTFFNRNLSLNFTVRDLLNSRRFVGTTQGIGFYQTSESYFHGRIIGLTATWNFGNSKPKPSEMRKQNQNNLNMDGDMD